MGPSIIIRLVMRVVIIETITVMRFMFEYCECKRVGQDNLICNNLTTTG